MHKRDFIASAGASAVGAACAPAWAGAGDHKPVAVTTPRQRRPVPLEGDQSRATWQHYVGHSFVLPGGRLSLVEVVDAPFASPSPSPSPISGLEQFALVFEAKAPLNLAEDALVTLQHPTGQRLALRLQAAGQDRWHAHFSLLVSA